MFTFSTFAKPFEVIEVFARVCLSYFAAFLHIHVPVCPGKKKNQKLGHFQRNEGVKTHQLQENTENIWGKTLQVFLLSQTPLRRLSQLAFSYISTAVIFRFCRGSV